MVCKWFKWLVKQLQEDFTDFKDTLQSGGYFFVYCLRNNLLFWFREPVGQLCLLKRYPESTLLVLQPDIVWLRFCESELLCIYPHSMIVIH